MNNNYTNTHTDTRNIIAATVTNLPSPPPRNMFFTNWGTRQPMLERALMDGTKKTTLVNTKIVYPFGVAVDFPNEHVYWVDGYLSHVERVDYNGENRRIILKLKAVSKWSLCTFSCC